MNQQSIAATYPLSPLQQGMLFHTVYAPQSGVDIEQIVCTLPEPLDTSAFEQAWQRVIQRHDILRTAFRWEGLEQPLQVVHSKVVCPFEIYDWRELAEDAREVQLDSFLQADRTRGFELGQPPLMRLTLFWYAENDFCLVWTFHHILLDGRAFPLVLNEVFAFYEAILQQQELQLGQPRPYRDYIAWLQQQDLAEARKFWQQLLLGFSTPTPLVVAKSPTTAKENSQYHVQHLPLSPALTAGLQSLAQQNQLTLNTLVQGAWALLLGRYSGETEVVFGATRACRRSALDGEGTDSMVGLFINTLPVRVHLPPHASVLPYLREVRAQAIAVRKFEHTPLVQIQHWSNVPQELPLFDSLLVFENYSLSSILQAQGGKWQQRRFKVLEQTNYPLTLAAYGGDNLLLRLEYDAARFSGDTIRRMLGHLQSLLQGFVDDPEQLISDVPLLGEVERRQLLVAWNNTRADYPRQKCFHHLFEEQVARAPDDIAVIFEDKRLSYAQLDRQANQLARHLQTLGVGPEVLVGVYLERSLEMVVGLLGILKAGGAYLPLNLAYPHERLAFMLNDAGVAVLLSQNKLLQAGNLGQKLGKQIDHVLALDSLQARIAQNDDTPPVSAVTADNLVYVIYTSGSTGQPKGTMISHRGLVNYLSWCSRAYAVAEGQGTLVHSPLGFDLTVTALFSPLLVGQSVELIPEDGSDQTAEAFRLPDALRKGHDFSLVKVTPAHLEILNQQIPPGDAAGRTKRFIIGGEALHGETIAFWQAHAPQTKLVNEYGPTETVVGCCIYEVPAAASIVGDVPIGRPIANTQLYILDSHMQPVPVGVPGELYIGGDGVARGYLFRPALTAERFVPHPFGDEPGARLYRSGDLARYLPDGTIEFLGRLDHQVKIRGFRLELGEIEALLSRHPAVQEVVVMAREDTPGQKRLAAYVVPQQNETLTLDEIRRYLQRQLPDYMMPSLLILLNSLPLTVNGKVNRQMLPAPGPIRLLPETFAPPQTNKERVLAKIWAALLGVDRVGIHDDFFELGGDSIISLQIVARAGQAGIRLTPRQVFQHRTIAELAIAAAETPAIVAEQKIVTGPVLLTPIQHWFFAQNLPQPHHWNQTLLLETQQRLRPEILEQVLGHLMNHHDALRMRFGQTEHGWQQFNAGPDEKIFFTRIDLHDVPPAEQENVFKITATQLQAGLNLAEGPLVRLALFDLGFDKPNYLLMVIHHLVVDGVSWRILLEDFETLYRQLEAGESVKFPPKTTSYKQWAAGLAEYARSSLAQQEQEYWLNQFGEQIVPLPVDYPQGKNANTRALTQVVSVSLTASETQVLLHDVPPVYHTEINDVLLTALVQTFAQWTGTPSLLLDLEGHGREDIGAGIDVSRTVGWFTTIFPVLLSLEGLVQPGEALKSIKEQLRRVPHQGLGYGVLRYLGPDKTNWKLQELPQAEVSFNYLGQFDQLFGQNTLLQAGCESGLFGLDCELAGPSRSLQGKRPYLLEINGSITGNKLRLDWTYSTNIHQQSTIETLAHNFLTALRALIAHCQLSNAGGYTPSDFPEAGLSQPELDDLIAELRKTVEWQAMSNPFSPAQRDIVEAVYPLSPTQQGILFHTLLTPQAGVYFNQRVLTLQGQLNINMFRRAWQQVADRHQPLRTLFKWQLRDIPLQIVLRQVALPWEIHNLTALSSARQQELLENWLAQDRRQGFDLTRPPLIRLNLFKMAEDTHELVWSFHHIILGGWSSALILKEVFSVYHAFCCGQEIQLRPNRPYRDYIVWLQQQDLSPAEDYWRQALRGFTSPTALGVGRAQVDLQPDTAQHIGQQSFQMEPSTTLALQNLSRRHGLTLNTIFQGAWAILLSRYSGDDDVVFGTTVSGRPAELRDVESMVGLFINTLPVRVRVSPNASLLSWLKELQNQQLTLRQYEYSPLVSVQQWSDIAPDTPLFETILVFENYPVDTVKSEISQPEAGEVQILNIRDIELTHYPLVVVILPGDTLSIQISYNRRRFDPATISRLGDHLQTILKSMTREPHIAGISLLTEPERNRLLVAWNSTKTDFPRHRCIHQLFEAQVQATPQVIAVIFQDVRLSYQALNRRANQVAHYLRKLGVGPETPVGICVERSLEMVVGILGILKAGGAYVPLDPGYPQERLSYMVKNSGVSILLSQQELAVNFSFDNTRLICLDAGWSTISAEPEDNLDSRVDGGNLAYIMYTSGSTGQPKGTSIIHRSVVRLVKETNYANFSAAERFLQLAPMSFDAATLEIWAPLLNGGQLVIFPPHIPSLSELAQAIQTHQISILWLTAGLFHQMAEAEPERLNAVRQLLTGGDVVSPAPARRLLEQRKSGTLSNCYGPTENTTFTTHYPMTRPGQVGPSVPIGRPIANTQVYVLDRYLHPAPIGVPGELYIGGDGLARDYWQQPELTAARFVPNPFGGEPGARLYKTGDLVRYLPDGNLEFLGRIDSQVKIRGFRIEPGETETILGQHPDVQNAVVVVRQNAAGEKHLVAYVVPRVASAPAAGELRNFLAQKLPDYMIPSAFVLLDSLPLTPNGKVDKTKLPAPDSGRSDLEATFVAPRSETEERLAEIWADLLGAAQIGVRDDFFELGGHSLLAVSLMARIQKQFQQDLPLSVLFEAATIEKLAEVLQKLDNRSQSALVPIQPSGSRPPLFFVHPVGGNVLCYANLARCLGPEQPFYGLQSPGLSGELPTYSRLEELAAYYLEQLRLVQPEGPYFLGGWSMGGIIAFEMARQLHQRGQEIALLALLDSGLPSANRVENVELTEAKLLMDFITDLGKTLAKDVHITYNDMQGLSPDDQRAYIYKQAGALDLLPPDVSVDRFSRLFEVFKTNYRAMIAYEPQTYLGSVTYFQAGQSESGEFEWGRLSAQPVKVYSVPGDHYSMISMPNVKVLARQLQSYLGQIQTS